MTYAGDRAVVVASSVSRTTSSSDRTPSHGGVLHVSERRTMTNDFVTVTIYGQEELISPYLLPYISESARECEPPPHNRMDEARRRVELRT